MSIRSVAPEEVADISRRGTRSQSHGHAAWGATKAAAYHGGYAIHDAGRSLATSTAHHAAKLGGHIWSGLTALGSKAAHAATGMAHAAKEHLSTFTDHVAAAHNEVVQALNRAGNPNAYIHHTHFVRHHEMAEMIHKHIASVVRAHGLLIAGSSANHVVVAANQAAAGAHIDTILANTVKHTAHTHNTSAAVREQTGVITAVDHYVKHSGPREHAPHRASNAQAAASAAILTATVAGAEHVEAGHV